MRKLYILIILCCLLLLTVSTCKTILQKDKYSALNQTNSKQEKILNSQKLKSSDQARNTLLIENDTLNYWAWIQSSGFFHYHPETGFSGQNGQIWINGNQRNQRIEEVGFIENEVLISDSTSKEQSTTMEMSKVIEQSQTSKSKNIMWLIVGAGLIFLFWLFIRKRWNL